MTETPTVGIIRKTMSVGTAGAVDFRSDKERIARSTRKTAKYAKQTAQATRAMNGRDAQAEWQAQIAEWNANAAAGQQPPPGPPVFQAGWFVDEYDPRFLRWWDTTGPSQHVQLIPDGPPVEFPPPGQAALPAAAPSLGDELGRLGELHRSGVLSDDEFTAAKGRLLGQ